MSDAMIKINGKFFRQPHIDLLGRAAIKKLKPKLEELTKDEDLDSLYELVDFLIPELAQKDLNTLLLGDVKHILSDAGVAKFDDIGTSKDRITLGESSASISS